MTREELLAARANDVVETALHDGVCLGEAECGLVRDAVLFALLEVEREWQSIREALAELHGLQNGPPLLKYEAEWRHCMERVERLLCFGKERL